MFMSKNFALTMKDGTVLNFTRNSGGLTAVTPELAEALLAGTNIRNRDLQEGHVGHLAKEMAEGRWIENTGDAIKFDTLQRLADGQHRLAAIVRSGVTLNLLILTECDDRAQLVIDQGKRRTPRDRFKVKTNSDITSLAAAIVKGIRVGGRQPFPTEVDELQHYAQAAREVESWANAARFNGPSTEKKRLMSAIALAPIAKALHNEPSLHDTLKDFTVGIIEGAGDFQRFHNNLRAQDHAGPTNRVIVYRNVESALRTYVETNSLPTNWKRKAAA